MATRALAAARASRRVPLQFLALRPSFRSYSVTTSSDGQVGTLEYRLRFKDANGKHISPWHDIPLVSEKGYLNAVFEIPKNTKPKMEVSTKEEHNPIAQDVKKGKLRDYHGPIFWNYGMLPQTWEDPTWKHPVVQCCGDDDPVDVVEIGSLALAQGTVEPVKVLGVLAMIDDGELDWKIIAIRKGDALAAELHDIADVETKCPGVISGIREWFRWYKTPDGKPLNKFGYDEKALDKAFAMQAIEEAHEAWKKLRSGSSEKGKRWIG